MNSKRTLYKPATTEKVASKPKRKTLAQGRLVTKPTGGESGDHASGLIQGTLTDSSTGAAKTALTSSPRATRNVHPSNPRRNLPHVSQTLSPRVARPLRSLELSDEESDGLHSPKERSVLLVDASRQTKGPSSNEVDIAMGEAPSPAKVICHTPESLHASLRNSGSVEDARKITVDKVLPVRMVRGLPETDPTHVSPMVVRENVIAGSPVDHHTASQPTVSKNLLQTLMDEHDRQPSSYTHESGLSPPGDSDRSDYSIASSTRSFVDTTAELEKKKTKRGTIYGTSRTSHTSTTGMKSKARGPVKATDRTIMGHKDSSITLKPKITGGSSGALKPKSTGRVSKYSLNESGGKGLKPKSTNDLKPKKTADTSMKYRVPVQDVSVDLKPKRTGGTNTRTTPKHSSTSKGSGSAKKVSYTTSTPTAVDNQFNIAEVSAISQQNRFHLTPDIIAGVNKRREHEQNESHLSHMSHLSHGSNFSHASHLSHISHDSKLSSTAASEDYSRLQKLSEVSQGQIDLLYARYLQQVLLESQAKKRFREQEKSVMADMYLMSELLTQKKKRKAELEQNLARLQQINIVDDALNLQESGLAPVMSGINQLGDQYKTLSRALDTTRHQLPTKGVYIPDNEEEFANQLQSALQESEQLLGELSVMFRQHQPKVSSFADSINALSKTATGEVTELSRCHELLAAATTLMVQLCSLRIQDTELKAT